MLFSTLGTLPSRCKTFGPYPLASAISHRCCLFPPVRPRRSVGTGNRILVAIDGFGSTVPGINPGDGEYRLGDSLRLVFLG